MFKKTLLTLAIVISSTTAMANDHGSHDMNFSGQIDVKYSKVDSTAASINGIYGSESANLDLDSLELGTKLNFFDNYFVKASYADMSNEQKEKEIDLGYQKDLSEIVTLRGSVGYHMIEDNLVNADIDSVTFKLSTHTKLTNQLTLDLGVETFDTSVDLANVSLPNMDDVSTDFVAGVTYYISDDFTFSLEHRDMLKETGMKVSWHF
tara:strand:+ start:6130 stop:6750 length:621 start_codon:yes stop_codon:yes gene_type:complete